MNNPELLKEVSPSDSELKEIIINYVGEKLNPENNEITVKHIIDIFAQQFPEFLLALAEENWINGYTQALKDTEFVHTKNDNTKLYNTKREKQQ